MIINLSLKSKREAISLWLSLLSRFHKLTDKEMEVTVEIILTYYEYLEKYKSREAACKLYLEKDSRVAIRKTLGNMTQQVLNNYITILKKKKVLEEGFAINKALLPEPDGNKVSLTINLLYEQ